MFFFMTRPTRKGTKVDRNESRKARLRHLSMLAIILAGLAVETMYVGRLYSNFVEDSEAAKRILFYNTILQRANETQRQLIISNASDDVRPSVVDKMAVVMPLCLVNWKIWFIANTEHRKKEEPLKKLSNVSHCPLDWNIWFKTKRKPIKVTLLSNTSPLPSFDWKGKWLKLEEKVVSSHNASSYEIIRQFLFGDRINRTKLNEARLVLLQKRFNESVHQEAARVIEHAKNYSFRLRLCISISLTGAITFAARLFKFQIITGLLYSR